jgi:hypothetical protein
VTDPVGPREVQQQLDRLSDVERTTTTARRRYIRRYLVGLGACYAGWLLVIQATETWLADNAAARSVVIGLSVGLFFATALTLLQAEPVRARLSPRFTVTLILASAVCLGVPAALVRDYPIAGPVGAVLILGFWFAMAWWATRDR